METTNTTNSAEEKAPETAKWYTRALKFPQLIGKTPNGGKIPGGPYTFTQFGVFAVVLVVGGKVSISNAEGFAVIGRSVIVLAIAFTLTLLAGRLPFGARNPLSVLDGALHAFSAPSKGKIAGRPVRTPRAHRVTTRLTVTASIPAAGRAPVAAPTSRRRTRPAKARRPQTDARQAAPPVANPLRPTPAAARTTPTPALTGVQRLLASSGSSRQED